MLAGRDVVGCAQTGTGKTAAFVLPILQNMSAPMIVDGKKAHPTALVVTPTRELCGQIEEVGETLATYSGRRVVAVFGGVPYDPQAKRIRKGVDLLVATPGRLLDMLRQGDVLLDKVDTLVLDEADRMLDMGFWPDVKRIIDAIPAKRQNLFFSATMSKTVLSIIADTLHDPIFIELGGTRHAGRQRRAEGPAGQPRAEGRPARGVLPPPRPRAHAGVHAHAPPGGAPRAHAQQGGHHAARPSTATARRASASRRSTASKRARSPCSWPPTSSPAASTSTTSRT